MRPRGRILIVENDHIVARDIGEQLARMGHYIVGVISRGEDAVKLANNSHADLVLMDIRLGGNMDGIEAARLIRSRRQIPIVFLTAYADDDTVRRASRADPFGYLLKPFEDLQLRTVVEMALYKHHADRKHRDSERRYEATLSSIADGVIATDALGYITFINPAAETMTGWPATDAIGKSLEDIYCVSVENGEAILLARDEKTFFIDEKTAPIVGDNGSKVGAVLVFSDRSEQRKAADALQAAQADLARMSRITTVGQLTASIAHEVNQPLTALVTNAEACANWLNAGPANVDEARYAAERVVTEGYRAAAIIHRIRAIVRNTTVAVETIDLNGLVLGVVAIVQPDLARQGITFIDDLHLGRLATVGDPVQLQQVILNLLANAADAIRASSHPERSIRMNSGIDHSGGAYVAFEDTGRGIDPNQSEMIFDPFFTTKPGGFGIGLSLCRSIVEAHGGRLWAEPRSPYGTRFRFTLPQCQI